MTGGIGLALAAAVASAFAVALQARENRRAPLAGSGGRLGLLRGLARRPGWLAGTALMAAVWPLQVAALTMAPLTVVQPLLATTQLVLLGVARLTLRERVGLPEALGALGIVVGISAVVWAAPRHPVAGIALSRTAAPIILVGLAALVAYARGRRRPVALVLGSGLAYAWVDFVNKLLAGALTGDHWLSAAVWLAATLLFGGLAFVAETSALQRRPAVTVAPVIGAVQSPLPVLMALWAGLESWGGQPHRVTVLLLGLAVISAGAAALGRSAAVTRVSGEEGHRSAQRATVAAAGAQ